MFKTVMTVPLVSPVLLVAVNMTGVYLVAVSAVYETKCIIRLQFSVNLTEVYVTAVIV